LAKTGGPFDDVLEQVDNMIKVLKDEDEADHSHRDRCEDKQRASKMNKQDAEYDLDKAEKEIEQLEQAESDKTLEIHTLEDQMAETQHNMDDITATRHSDTADFEKEKKDDEEAIVALGQAQDALSKFYKATSMLQVAPTPVRGARPSYRFLMKETDEPATEPLEGEGPAPAEPLEGDSEGPAPAEPLEAEGPASAEPEPEAPAAATTEEATTGEAPTTDDAASTAVEPAPRTNFKDGDYKGKAGDARSVMVILDMIKQDVGRDIKKAIQEESESQAAYEKELATLKEAYHAADSAKTAAEVEVAGITTDKSNAEEEKDAAQTDLDNELHIEEALAQDCGLFVEVNFDKRAERRKGELSGLKEAKSFLAAAGMSEHK